MTRSHAVMPKDALLSWRGVGSGRAAMGMGRARLAIDLAAPDCPPRSVRQRQSPSSRWLLSSHHRDRPTRSWVCSTSRRTRSGCHFLTRRPTGPPWVPHATDSIGAGADGAGSLPAYRYCPGRVHGRLRGRSATHRSALGSPRRTCPACAHPPTRVLRPELTQGCGFDGTDFADDEI